MAVTPKHRRELRAQPSRSAGDGQPTGSALPELRDALLAWFAATRRDLPWRRSRDPYRVWLSETMLQQTRVEAVVPYFERFTARFPTVADLAAAPVEDVLAAWSGLGYYRRARSLHAAARAVVERHDGHFPSARADLLELPGIGPYTAGAIASIAFDAAEPLVDGNVARVLARLFLLDMPQESSAFRGDSWRIAGELLAGLGGRSPGDWNQALMELGALVCTPRAPRCLVCPVRAHCRASSEGRVDELPVPKKRPATIEVELHVALVRDGARVLVTERPSTGRMAGLWELPTIEPAGEARLATGAWPRDTRGSSRLAIQDELGAVAHSITRHKIRARVFAGRWIEGATAEPLRFVTPDELAGLGPTGLTAKVLRASFVR